MTHSQSHGRAMCRLARRLGCLVGTQGAFFCACALLGSLMTAVAPAQTRHSAATSPTMIYEGFTQPRHDIMVAAAEIGRLDAMHVAVGDRVVAGQVIGQLEDALQAASVEIAELQAVMTGEWDAAKAETELNRGRAGKLRKLANEGMARPDETQRAEAELQISLARQLAAEEQLRLRGLELKRYRLQLERRKILSPMDGVISKVFHQAGEYVTPSEPAVVRLLVIDTIDAVFNVPVEDVAGMKPGTPVVVYLRSSSVTLDAHISVIAPDIDGESGTVEVRVQLDNGDGRLLVGDRCTLQLKSHRGRPNAASLGPPGQGARR
jgi:RND family efflux transporter MFP subunit